ncbi:MAG: Hsp20/alpha crystallin family protein [Desulforhabdus sp.]|jgi:HSP20 family protein|nr:Hsp20/alpha crystallin family protein [Desulforhabdus sp.]
MPAFDISEADDHIVVRADLPGIDAKDLDINLSGNVLSISGEKKKEEEQRGENYYSIEKQFGSFCRTLTLPAEVKEEGIEATYEDGVLRLMIPKVESAKRKKIEVKQV